MGTSPSTLIQIYKQCVHPIFEYGSLSTITSLDYSPPQRPAVSGTKCPGIEHGGSRLLPATTWGSALWLIIYIHIHLFIFIFICLYSYSSIYIHIHLFIFISIYLYSYSSIYINIHLLIFTFMLYFLHSGIYFHIHVAFSTFIVMYARFFSFICSSLDQPVVHLKFPDDVMPSITRILAIILHCKMNGSVGAAECRSLCTRKVIGSAPSAHIFMFVIFFVVRFPVALCASTLTQASDKKKITCQTMSLEW